MIINILHQHQKLLVLIHKQLKLKIIFIFQVVAHSILMIDGSVMGNDIETQTLKAIKYNKQFKSYYRSCRCING